ncbi:hypothetical protein ACFQ29_39145 [Longispora fulva]
MEQHLRHAAHILGQIGHHTGEGVAEVPEPLSLGPGRRTGAVFQLGHQVRVPAGARRQVRQPGLAQPSNFDQQRVSRPGMLSGAGHGGPH